MTRTPTAYVDDAARALRQARTYLADELARIDAALAALDLEHADVTIEIDADARLVEKAFADAADAVRARRKPSTANEYPCTHPGCDYVAKSPGALGGHMNRHRRHTADDARPATHHLDDGHPCPDCDFVAASSRGLGVHRTSAHRPLVRLGSGPLPAAQGDHDGHTIDAGPVTVLEDDQADGEAVHVCDECGETFRWPTELSRHRRTLGHYQEDKA